MSISVSLFRDLPDAESAQRFIDRLTEDHPSHSRKLLQNEALLSDVLTIAAHSPLLASTLQQNPEYIWWLKRRRVAGGVRNKDELLESLARFALTNSQVGPQILFARFRRRELLRIFLADIRRLATIAEITEEISNLADAILENALRVARQELDNRYGSPLEIDDKGKKKSASFCVVSLGKLGSKELNYASDIDLLFLYSSEGETSGSGARGQITNREYFVKLAEQVAKLVGEQTGEGATYRVDLRLRPHGRVGPLALSVQDTAKYYQTESADWERQVLIRSRSSAGDAGVFHRFFDQVEDDVFSKDQSVEQALRSVRLSKQKIDLEHTTERGSDVKLGKGGIREIEFIAQALQLAYGGKDRWLRASHTLISLSRLADRKLITDVELTQLFDAYEFLRRLEHILQMEHGLQTHLVPNEPERRSLVARKMDFAEVDRFNAELKRYAANVNRTFRRVFSDENIETAIRNAERSKTGTGSAADAPTPPRHEPGFAALDVSDEKRTELNVIADVAPKFGEMIAAHPGVVLELPDLSEEFPECDYADALTNAVENATGYRSRLAALRTEWSKLLLQIIMFDAGGKLAIKESKRRQTQLAEAGIETALSITKRELNSKYSTKGKKLDLAVLGLGKLGGAGIDYDSDLDLVLVYDDEVPSPVEALSHPEYYARAAEILVNVLSGMTREGSLYRVDLRLRPHGKNGPNVISRKSFAEYMRTTAAIWEMLAFVKIRAIGGNLGLANEVENEISGIIHERAITIPNPELAEETHRIRLRLENERSRGRRTGDVDIKFGPGGMLDIYFALRFLQLRDNVPEDRDKRSTDFMLELLHSNGSLAKDAFENLLAGYNFLSALDHYLRLTVGRSTLLPRANLHALETIAGRMDLASVAELDGQLALHRLNIREAFDAIVGPIVTV